MADIHSRKWSTIIGVVLIGLGFVVEGSFPTFFFVMFSQVIWGIGAAFVSGAREAWITDKIGENKANKAFLHAEQLAQYVLLIIMAIGCVFGMFSEGFNRLWTPYILQFNIPAIGHFKPIIWFGIISYGRGGTFTNNFSLFIYN